MNQKTYDLLVIGGGINGCAVANLASVAGLRVYLAEKGDFASGTSSKSTKLIHGGIRYLEQMQFSLVREALRERKAQMERAPHLVRPLGFMIPVYQGDKRPLWMVRIGVFLYDWVAGRKYTIKKHQALSRKEIIERVPGIKIEGLKGGFLYYDAQMNDARLCLENALQARENGAEIHNYHEVEKFVKQNGRVCGAMIRDKFSGQLKEIYAKDVLVAGGPWTNQLLRRDDIKATKLIRTTKGVHLICRRRLSDQALLLSSGNDGRVFFVIPWGDHSLVGTTDTDYVGSPDKVEVTETDIEYLLEKSAHYLPTQAFSKQDVIASFAGLRPLLRQVGSPSSVTREHSIVESKSGVYFVCGGKFTTYRVIATDCLKRIYSSMEIPELRLYGGGSKESSSAGFGSAENIKMMEHLRKYYGTRASEVKAIIDENPEWKQALHPDLPILKGEINYHIRKEMAKTAEDIIERRLSLHYLPQYKGQDKERILAVICQAIATEKQG